MRARYGPAIRDLGVQNCRKKLDRQGNQIGDEWSQHSWGNAWDFRVPPGLRDQLNVLLDQHPAVAWYRDYGDGQYHVDGEPVMTGTPPCAGGADPPDKPAPDPGTGTNPSDQPDSLPERIGGAVETLTSRQTWTRVLLVVLGAAGLLVAVLLLMRDIVPVERIAGIAADAAVPG